MIEGMKKSREFSTGSVNPILDFRHGTTIRESIDEKVKVGYRGRS